MQLWGGVGLAGDISLDLLPSTFEAFMTGLSTLEKGRPARRGLNLVTTLSSVLMVSVSGPDAPAAVNAQVSPVHSPKYLASLAVLQPPKLPDVLSVQVLQMLDLR